MRDSTPKSETTSKNTETDGATPKNAWASLEEYGKKHPFGFLGEMAEKRRELQAMRRRHVSYLNGFYSPTESDLNAFDADQDFYKSKIYLQYQRRLERQKRKLDKDARKFQKRVDKQMALVRELQVDLVNGKTKLYRPDVYRPKDETIRETTHPYIEAVRGDVDTLVSLGDHLESADDKSYPIEVLTSFFAEKYNLKNRPSLTMLNDPSSDTKGAYNHIDNSISINLANNSTAADYIDCISHELWHAHQHESKNDNPLYLHNFEYYIPSHIDEDAYCEQVIESEAYMVGGSIMQIYERAQLRSHPETIPMFQQKFEDFVLGKDQSTKDLAEIRQMAYAELELLPAELAQKVESYNIDPLDFTRAFVEHLYDGLAAAHPDDYRAKASDKNFLGAFLARIRHLILEYSAKSLLPNNNNNNTKEQPHD